MLEKIFAQVLDMALAGSFVILAVLLVRGLMSKFPKRYVYALWLIVGIRLICPVTLYSPLSLFNLDFAAGLRMPVESMGGAGRPDGYGGKKTVRKRGQFR